MSTPEHVEGFDAALHLAALSNDPLGDINPSLTYDINLDVSVRLARAAKDAGVERFLFSSSCSLYGAPAGVTFSTRTAAVNPVTPHGESKVRVEQAVSELADDSFSPVYLRNATAYRVSRRRRRRRGQQSPRFRHYNRHGAPPEQRHCGRPLVHIHDIIAAF